MINSDQYKHKLSIDAYNEYNVGNRAHLKNNSFQVIEKRDNTTNGLRAYVFVAVVNSKPDSSRHTEMVNTSLYRD